MNIIAITIIITIIITFHTHPAVSQACGGSEGRRSVTQGKEKQSALEATSMHEKLNA